MSDMLVNVLSNVEGVESIYPVKSYSFNIAIARLFNEYEVKKNVTERFKTFIKAHAAIEAEELDAESEEVIGIQLPNGQEFYADENNPFQLTEFNKILESFPNSKLIYANKKEN